MNPKRSRAVFGAIAAMVQVFGMVADARAGDGIPVTIISTPSVAMKACVDAIRQGNAKIGSDPVDLHFATEDQGSTSGRSVSLRLYRPEGNDPMEWTSAWGVVRRPFAFKDADHFRRFQTSPLAEAIGQGTYVAYGGAHHLISFRLPMTEPAHFAGKSVLGAKTADLYDAFGATHDSWADRDWTHGARQLLKGETATLAIEAKGITERIVGIRADRFGVAGMEIPLFSVGELGIDKVARFLNLSFSSVDPIVVDPSDLVEHIPRSQRVAATAWAKAISLSCSAGVFREEAKVIAALKAGGVKVVPMNRAAFAPKVWLADLGYAYGNYLLTQVDALVTMGWALGSRPSQMLATLPPEARAALVASDEKAAAEAAEKKKEHDESAKGTSDHVRAQAVIGDVVTEYTAALRTLPPAKPSGHLVGFLGLPPQRPITAAPIAAALADDLEALLDPVQTCPAAQAPCHDQIAGWLDIARTRAATRSTWMFWSKQSAGSDKAIDRAIALATSAADGTFKGNLEAAKELKAIGAVQSDIGHRALRKTIDAAATLVRTPWPSAVSADDESNASTTIPGHLDIDEWTVLSLHGLGDDAAARARFKDVQAFVVRTKAVTEAKAWKYNSLWRMRLALADWAGAWSDYIDHVEQLDQPNRFDCGYGSKACAGRRDIRRASAVAQSVLGLALKDLQLEHPAYDENWLQYYTAALQMSDTPDLAREHAKLVKDLQAMSVSDVDPSVRDWAAGYLKFDALNRDTKNKMICKFRRCVGDDPTAEAETYAEIAQGGRPSSLPLDATHPFQVAVAAKDWATVFAALERLAHAGKAYGDADKTYAEVFPDASGSSERTESLAMIAAEAAVQAGDLATARRAVTYDGDSKAGSFAGARPKTLDTLLQMIVTTAAVD